MAVGVRFELFELGSPAYPCRDPVFGGPPVWVCEVAAAGVTPRSVPVDQVRPTGHTPVYVLRITAHEAAYVLTGRGALVPTTANGYLMLTDTQIMVLVGPGDFGAWSSAA